MRRSTIVVAASLALAAPAAAQNQLTNPGFETGSLAGWTVGGNNAGTVFVATDGTAIPGAGVAFAPGFVNVRSGTFAAGGLVRCGAFCGNNPPERFTLSQTLMLAPNTMYTVGFYLGDDSQTTFGYARSDALMQIFFNGVGLLPSSGILNSPVGGTSADFQLISGSFTTDGTGVGTVTFQINGSGTDAAPVSVDDFFVDGPTVTATAPEPATLALMGSGLLVVGGAAVRRRRTS